MRYILFIQGGGNDGYAIDKKLVSALQQELGNNFTVSYPELRSDETVPDFGWPKQICNAIDPMVYPFAVVAHSLGASMLLKYLSEDKINRKPSGIFLLATPFWKGPEDWKQGLKLNDDFVEKLPKDVPYFFYHCKDDEEVPFEHFETYRQKMSDPIFREIQSGGHMFKADLKVIAEDIKNL
ncbi:MAG: alpha/beta hydrolase [Mucilaginibacter sp.]|nr:alpha/beta hydrolase [Mucilaginibacter sp.]